MKAALRKIIYAVLCAAIVLSVFMGCERNSEETLNSGGVALYTVTRVIDGDTVELNTGETIRYIGVDTPETVHPTKPVECYGKEASAFNKQLVEGKKVKLEFDVQRKDQYGRVLAYVYLEDGTFVNAELVKQGYARIATYPPNVKYSDLFLKLEREARENKRGLWEVCVEPPPEKYVASRKSVIFHKLSCRYVKQIKPENKVFYHTREEAIADGKRPCLVCKP